MAENDSACLPPSQSTNACSYSTVVQQNVQIPAPVSTALTRAAIKEHQILFEPAIGRKFYEPNNNSMDIIKKFKQALSTVQTEDSPNLQIKASTHLQNGGLIIELTTAEAANWICMPVNREKIISALDLPATIKEHQFSIIILFLPSHLKHQRC
ncbi:hypothetical protein DFH29DRAFT_1006673 [Suillus ampliporus]|nr:hypothetical protein DFH29DRAFT_1006673 [Suillus ampliporus]